ncbi:hypothetical protein Tco_0760905 [Tanacetum coccineum]
MSSWKANLLSIGGRLTLIKSVLGSLGNYYFSIFTVHELVIKSLESLRAIFFWGGYENNKKIAWVKWSNIVASFDKGGLGVGSLKAFNKALLLKWRWHLFNFLKALWVQVVKALHGEEAGMDFGGCQSNGVWAKLLALLITFTRVIHVFGILSIDALLVEIVMETYLTNTSSFAAPINRCLDLDSIACMVCNGSVESNAHTFFTCDTAAAIWRIVRSWIKNLGLTQFSQLLVGVFGALETISPSTPNQ